MIDQLNNDCQLFIIHNLDPRSQITLWKATKNFSVRLNDNICRVWRNNKYFLAWILSEFEKDPATLDELLSRIGAELQSPELLYLTLNQLKLLENHKLSNVRVLEYERNAYFQNTQSPEFLLPEIFPELKSLKICGGCLRGFNFQKFSQLSKLEIWDCYGYGGNLTGHETLEELILDTHVHENVFNCNTVKNFPKLHTISFPTDSSIYPKNPHFYGILGQKSIGITELSFNRLLSCYIRSRFKLPKELRRLSVIDDKDLTMNELLALISGSMLEQLDLVDSPVFSSEEQLWKTVTVCPSMRILNISGMKMKNDFFELSRNHMKDALGNRSEPLELHCHNFNRNLVSTTQSNA